MEHLTYNGFGGASNLTQPTGFFCGWSVGVEFFARLLADSGIGTDKF